MIHPSHEPQHPDEPGWTWCIKCGCFALACEYPCQPAPEDDRFWAKGWVELVDLVGEATNQDETHA